MDSPIGNWSPDKLVIRKSLSRRSNGPAAIHRSFVTFNAAVTWVVISILSKKNVSQCECFKKFPPLVLHLFRPVNFFPNASSVFPDTRRYDDPLHLSGIRLRNLNAECRTIKYLCNVRMTSPMIE